MSRSVGPMGGKVGADAGDFVALLTAAGVKGCGYLVAYDTGLGDIFIRDLLEDSVRG